MAGREIGIEALKRKGAISAKKLTWVRWGWDSAVGSQGEWCQVNMENLAETKPYRTLWAMLDIVFLILWIMRDFNDFTRAVLLLQSSLRKQSGERTWWGARRAWEASGWDLIVGVRVVSIDVDKGNRLEIHSGRKMKETWRMCCRSWGEQCGEGGLLNFTLWIWLGGNMLECDWHRQEKRGVGRKNGSFI